MKYNEIKVGRYYLVDESKFSPENSIQDKIGKCIYKDKRGILIRFIHKQKWLHDGNGGCEGRYMRKFENNRHYWVSKYDIIKQVSKDNRLRKNDIIMLLLD